MTMGQWGAKGEAVIEEILVGVGIAFGAFGGRVIFAALRIAVL
jgi:hypothetical protein